MEAAAGSPFSKWLSPEFQMSLTLFGIAFAAALWFVFANRREKASIETKGEGSGDDWTMVDWVDEAGPKILVALNDRPKDAHATFSIAVLIEWRYASGGLPDPATMERIYRLETALEELRGDKSSILVHTLTGNGIREWCHYTTNYSAFEARFNELVGNLPAMPLELSFQTDPTWGYWRKIKSVALGNGV